MSLTNADPATVLERLMAHSEWQGECLVWMLGRGGFGYGDTTRDGRHVAVHRAAWVARHGEIPPETPCVLHHCDNPPCWRDEHLWLGTRADNAADRVAKGRDNPWNARKTHCPQGHPYDEANTYHSRRGSRCCRACSTARSAARSPEAKRASERKYKETHRSEILARDRARIRATRVARMTTRTDRTEGTP